MMGMTNVFIIHIKVAYAQIAVMRSRKNSFITQEWNIAPTAGRRWRGGMPIELWPWAGKLFYTGWLTLMILGPIGIWVDNAKPGSKVALVLAILAIAPIAIFAVTVAVWIVTNILIMIWR
jgi:hypothetical protein